MAEIMAQKGITKAQLGRAVGIDDEKNPADVIYKRMKQKNISVNVLDEMLKAMGYSLVIAPTGHELQEGEYKIGADVHEE